MHRGTTSTHLQAGTGVQKKKKLGESGSPSVRLDLFLSCVFSQLCRSVEGRELTASRWLGESGTLSPSVLALVEHRIVLGHPWTAMVNAHDLAAVDSTVLRASPATARGKDNQIRTFDMEGYRRRASCLCFRSAEEKEVRRGQHGQ